jgi:hypothetical protein
MNRLMSTLTLTLTFLCAACARMNSIERTDNLPHETAEGRGTVLMIDAKQRVIYSSTRKIPLGTDKSQTIPIYCAEPSPDALSAYAANTGLSLSPKDAATLAAALSTAESSASIGLRTQSIQLMRDIMFRECEAFVDGADQDVAFMTAHRRLQSSMVAILAIEQLTGATKASQPVLTPKADAATAPTAGGDTKKDDADKVKGAQGNDDAATADVKKKKDSQTTADAEAKADPTNTTKQTTAANAKKASEEATKKKTQTAAALTNAKKKQDDDDKPPVAKPADNTAVATAVQAIVEDTLDLAFSHELCVTVLAEYPKDAPNPPTGNTFGSCLKLLDASVATQQADTAVTLAQAHFIEACAATLQASKKLDSACAGLANPASKPPGPEFTRTPTQFKEVGPRIKLPGT